MPYFDLNQGPPNAAWTTVLAYTGTDAQYIGKARSFQGSDSPITVTTASNAAACVITATAHKILDGNKVTISGFTGNWAGANGSWPITYIDANSFSIPVDSSGFGAFGAQAPTVTTRAPKTSAAVWSIQKLFYDGAGLNDRTAWANGSPSADQVWDNRATLSYQ